MTADTFNSCWFGDRLLPLANACINSFGAHGFPCRLYTHGWVEDVPAFVDRRDAEPIVPKHELFVVHGGLETAADLFACRLLEQFGGWYVDNDVICNANGVPQVEIAFAEERAGMVNNAVLKFPAHHPAIVELLEYVATVDQTTAAWGTTGPLALTKIFAGYPELARHQLRTADCYPLHWKEAPKLLFPEFTDEVLAKTADSPFVHLWGSALREIQFNKDLPIRGSYMDLVYSKYLDPHILAGLRPRDEGAFRSFVRTYVEDAWGVSLAMA